MRKDQWIGAGLVLALAVLVGVGLWQTSGDRDSQRVAVVRRCPAVMGTSCQLAGVVSSGLQADAEGVLRGAETALRDVEARMSTWLADSEVSVLNSAEADREVPLSPPTLEVLRAAHEACQQTDGAMDVTCRPLVELWRAARERGAVPDEAKLAQARAASGWELIRLWPTGAIKRRKTARVDLGGIAKGYAIDRALGVLRCCLEGGLVDIGGDLACYGKPASGDAWIVDVQNPFGPGKLASLRITGGAVCTSGNYARYFEIGGRRYSHIIDPRTGRPADAAASVTVVGRSAMLADAWATALSVLGPEGLERLPEGMEAMMVVGTKDDYQVTCTAGFGEFWEERPLAGQASGYIID